MSMKLGEALKVNCQGYADIDTSDQSSAVYVDVTNFRRILTKVMTTTSLTNGKILSLQLMQATSAAGAGAKVLGSPVTFTATGTAKAEVSLDTEINSILKDVEGVTNGLDVAGGFKFVGFQVSSDLGSAVIAAVTQIFGDAGYLPVS